MFPDKYVADEGFTPSELIDLINGCFLLPRILGALLLGMRIDEVFG